ncbi:hypothetical protein GJ496_012069 [Pomphorhynchus laevis]|nr:hypothetical protein GJ496_012069 [Pomphorhynchus laevis]
MKTMHEFPKKKGIPSQNVTTNSLEMPTSHVADFLISVQTQVLDEALNDQLFAFEDLGECVKKTDYFPNVYIPMPEPLYISARDRKNWKQIFDQYTPSHLQYDPQKLKEYSYISKPNIQQKQTIPPYSYLQPQHIQQYANNHQQQIYQPPYSPQQGSKLYTVSPPPQVNTQHNHISHQFQNQQGLSRGSTNNTVYQYANEQTVDHQTPYNYNQGTSTLSQPKSRIIQHSVGTRSQQNTHTFPADSTNTARYNLSKSAPNAHNRDSLRNADTGIKPTETSMNSGIYRPENKDSIGTAALHHQISLKEFPAHIRDSQKSLSKYASYFNPVQPKHEDSSQAGNLGSNENVASIPTNNIKPTYEKFNLSENSYENTDNRNIKENNKYERQDNNNQLNIASSYNDNEPSENLQNYNINSNRSKNASNLWKSAAERIQKAYFD